MLERNRTRWFMFNSSSCKCFSVGVHARPLRLDEYAVVIAAVVDSHADAVALHLAANLLLLT